MLVSTLRFLGIDEARFNPSLHVCGYERRKEKKKKTERERVRTYNAHADNESKNILSEI